MGVGWFGGVGPLVGDGTGRVPGPGLGQGLAAGVGVHPSHQTVTVCR